MFRIAIVEDDRVHGMMTRKALLRIIEENDLSTEIDLFETATSFLEEYHFSYDIIFMDIDLPGINGLEAARKLRKIDQTVILFFMTNLSQYAIQGYEVAALDYILKPITYEQLKLKMGRAILQLSKEKNKEIIVSYNNQMVKVSVQDILYIEVIRHTLTYHTLQGDVKEYGTLKNASQKLNDTSFVLVHRSCLVNLYHVKAIVDDIVLVENQQIMISRGRKKQLLEAMNSFMGRK